MFLTGEVAFVGAPGGLGVGLAGGGGVVVAALHHWGCTSLGWLLGAHRFSCHLVSDRSETKVCHTIICVD